MALVEYLTENRIGILTIHRPEALNALNADVMRAISTALDGVDLQTVRCLIVTGSGETAFAAGADIELMSTQTQAEAAAFSTLGNNALRKMEEFPLPTIAVINGYALGGGCELCMSCDIRLAAETAVFGLPEASLGVTPGFGGTQRLARLVGTGRAKELIFTGRTFRADEALKIGLVEAVYPKTQLMKEALQMAARIAENAPIAVRMCKKSINAGLDTDIDTGVAQEARNFGSCFETYDQREGMRAFLEKRQHAPYRNS